MKNFKKLTLLMAFAAIASSVCANQKILFPQPEVVNEVFRTAQELDRFISKETVTSPVALSVGQDFDSKNDAQAATNASAVDPVESTMNFINNVLSVKSFYDLSLTAWSVTKTAAIFVSTQAQAGLTAAATATTYLPTVQQVTVFAAPYQGLIPFVGVVTLTTAYLRNKDAALKAEYAENAGKEDSINAVDGTIEDTIVSPV